MLELLRQFTRFTGVGFISAAGHYGLLITLVQGMGVEPVRASVAGALLGAWINYVMNYRYTFRSRQRHRESVAKFAVVAAVGLLLNTFFMWLGVDVLNAYYLLSQVVTTVLVLFWSFGANRYWTFRA
ncbi:MAG: GtrA family protein [Rhodocyclaceae bacterium]|nr:MAG: GtrA family protein [Rhodocyclaceae bacterium]